MKEKKTAAFRQGFMVLLALAVLTGIEYVISINSGSLVFLLLIALGKAALILNVFMHVANLWQEESH